MQTSNVSSAALSVCGGQSSPCDVSSFTPCAGPISVPHESRVVSPEFSRGFYRQPNHWWTYLWVGIIISTGWGVDVGHVVSYFPEVLHFLFAQRLFHVSFMMSSSSSRVFPLLRWYEVTS